MEYHSQIGQDKYFIENINNGKRGGTFLDIGAHDGIFNSNTYALEKNLDWIGYCIEANPSMYKLLTKNRNCQCILGAAWSENTKLTFEIPTREKSPNGKLFGSELGRIKGLSGNERYFQNWFEDTNTFEVDAFKISDKIPNINHIDYLTLDVEGAELEVLKGLDLQNLNVSFMTIEHGNRPNQIKAITKFVSEYDYIVHRINRFDIEFQKNETGK